MFNSPFSPEVVTSKSRTSSRSLVVADLCQQFIKYSDQTFTIIIVGLVVVELYDPAHRSPYHCLRLGPPWWFGDSAEGMLRFRNQTTETAGFYNTVGFNDDTRAFLSIPARHDVARRVDCGFLATLVAEHLIGEAEAASIARELAYGLAKKAYHL